MPRIRARKTTSERGAVAIAVVLRREVQGPVLAVEFARGSDFLDARAELGFEALYRRGRFDAPLESVPGRPEPIYRQTEDGVDVCLGFSLSTDPELDPQVGEAIRCVFPRTFLEPVAARAARRLLEAGVLETGDTYTYELRGEAADEGSVASEALGSMSAGTPGATPDATPDVTVVAAAAASPFEVVRTPIAPLLDGAEPVHTALAAADDYPVFFTRSALERAEEVARKGAGARPAVETGGLLIGPLCYCDESGTLFAVVVDVLEATHSEATTYSLTYSGETWARIQRVMRAKQGHPDTRGQRVLGQVHGHSFLPLNGAEPCADCATREFCTRTTAFLSSDDLAWCRAVFRGEPWQLSQIFGLNARNEGVEAFFGQRGGQLVARGYSVVERFEP